MQKVPDTKSQGEMAKLQFLGLWRRRRRKRQRKRNYVNIDVDS